MLKDSDTNKRSVVKRSTNRRFQLCGRQLHQMLTVVCSNRRGKRSAKETEGSIGVFQISWQGYDSIFLIISLVCLYQICFKISDDLFTSIYRPYSDLDYEPSLTFGSGFTYSNGSPLESYFETSYQVKYINDDVLRSYYHT